MDNDDEKYMTEEAARELEKINEQFRKVIFAHASLLSEREGVLLINDTHIRNAYKKFRLGEAVDRLKWFIEISFIILIPEVFFQTSQVNSLLNLSMTLLPITIIIWLIVLSYLFKEYWLS